MDVIKLPFYARLALTLLAIVLILFLLSIGSDIFIPMVFALLIAVLLYPLNKVLENRLHLGRALSALLCVIIFISCIGVFVYFLSIQIINFSQDLPELQKKVQLLLFNLQRWIAHEYHVNTRQQTDYLNRSASNIIGTAANSIGNIFLSLTKLILWTVFVFIYSFFMLYHRRLLLRFILSLFNSKNRSKVYDVTTQTRGMINSYIVGLLIEMLILSIVNCTAFLIMDIKYAILLGVMAAVLNIIPYLGFYTALALSMLVTFANTGSNTALAVGITLAIIHVLDANILMPRIVGSRVKMNPFITIVAVIVGEFIWGVPGTFLFIPLIGILKLIFERVDGMQPWALLIGVEEDEPRMEQMKKTNKVIKE